MKKKWKKNPYLKVSLYAFGTIAACILFYQLSRDFSFISTFFGYLALIFGPVLYGGIFAYLLNPILNFYELTVFRRTKWKQGVRRVVSLVLTYLSALLLLGVLGVLIVPQLLESVDTMISNVPTYTANVQSFVDGLYAKAQELAGGQSAIAHQLTQVIDDTKNSVLSVFTSLVGAFPGFSAFLSGFTTEVTNVIVGIVVSVYLLGSKERFAAQSKKALSAFFKKKTVARVVDFFRDIHESVGGFILAKIIDGVIVGVLSFIVFSIFGVPFALLLAAIIAVCNIIPFFGQIIGPAIGVVILLVVAPAQVIWFILMCFIIMQIDGNVIGPRLIGKRIGISSFWTIVSLLAAGRMFGFWGMFLGAPVFAVLYGVIKRWLGQRLEARDCSSDTADYFDYLHEPPHGIMHIAFRKKKKSFSAPIPVEPPPKSKKKAAPTFYDAASAAADEKDQDEEYDDHDDTPPETPAT